MSFLCGFGKKKKSKKEAPYTKASNGKVSHQTQMSESKHLEKTTEKKTPADIVHSHNQDLDPHKVKDTSYLSRPPDKVTMTSPENNTGFKGEIKNGGLGVSVIPEPEDQKQETGKAVVDGNSNAIKPDHTNTVIIHSYQEAQDIERLSEQIMSGQKITSSDIVSTGSKIRSAPTDDHGLDKFGKRHTVPSGTSLVQGSQKDKGKDQEREYITADKMVDADFYYKMNHRRRGTCLIVNVGEFLPSTRMQNRRGYLVDGELMKDTFRRLGFDVQYLKNPTNLKLKQAMDEVALDDHTDEDCLAVVIMSHGNRNFSDIIFTKDGIMNLDFIIENFNGQNCPQLAGKPKLFFIQACRGDKLDPGQEVPYIDDDYDEMDAAPSAPRIPVEADILLSQATAPGYISFRNSQKGSIYIRCLNKALEEHAYNEDILSILTRVNAMVAFEFESNSVSKLEYHAKKQMPTFTCQLTKKLQFSPPRTGKF